GPDDGDVGHRTVRDPHLRAIQYPAITIATRRRDHAGRIGAVIGLREAEAADDLATGHPREIPLLLLFASERVDGIHAERALHGRERADARVAALELLHDEAVRDVVEAGAAVLL